MLSKMLNKCTLLANFLPSTACYFVSSSLISDLAHLKVRQKHERFVNSSLQNETMAMFTLYRIVKRSVAESVSDRASVHTRNAAFEAVSAPEQYCSALLLKVECSVSDRFLTVRIKSEHFYRSRNCNGTSFW